MKRVYEKPTVGKRGSLATIVAAGPSLMKSIPDVELLK